MTTSASSALPPHPSRRASGSGGSGTSRSARSVSRRPRSRLEVAAVVAPAAVAGAEAGAGASVARGCKAPTMALGIPCRSPVRSRTSGLIIVFRPVRVSGCTGVRRQPTRRTPTGTLSRGSY